MAAASDAADATERETALRRRRWISAAPILLLSLWLLRSFLVPILWAFFMALATWPFYRRFCAIIPRRAGPGLRAALFTAIVGMLVLGPFGFAFITIARHAESFVLRLADGGGLDLPAPEGLQGVPVAGPWLVEQWDAVRAPGGAARWLQQADSALLLGWGRSLGRFALQHAMVVTFTLLALFFVYRGGEPQAQRIERFVRGLGPHGEPWLKIAGETVRATMGGMIIVALVDGVLVGAACAVAGLPAPQVWGALTGILAVIPFAGYVAVAAAVAALAAAGSAGAATLLFAWGAFIVFAADKIVRPAIVGRSTGLDFFWVLVGTLGGLETFGLLGLFLGPVTLALAGALWGEFTDAS
ncbi:MAG TPA: AI-2E family transporter [Candidatus Polarisedimenticolia bacterium]|nr:AI-2E family transporter [Candidatus Polarisedimenticolia bacterium]